MAAEANKQPTAEDKEAAFMAAEAAKEDAGKKDAKGPSAAQDSTPAPEGAAEIRSNRCRPLTLQPGVHPPPEGRECLTWPPSSSLKGWCSSCLDIRTPDGDEVGQECCITGV